MTPNPRPRRARAALRFLAGLALLACAAGCASTDEEDLPEPLTDQEKAEALTLAERADTLFKAASPQLARKAEDEKGKDLPARLVWSSDEEAALRDALDACETLTDRYPDALADELPLVRLGLLQEAVGAFEDAHATWSRVLKRYRASARYPEIIAREMALARLFLEGEKRSFAGLKILGGGALGAEILEGVLDVAPFSRLAPEALYRLGNYRLENQAYEEAVVHFETLVRRFTDDPHAIKAEFQAARAHFLRFQALDYDLTPLEEAQTRFRAFVERHAGTKGEVTEALVGEDRGPNADPAARYTGARAWVHQIEDLLARKNLETGDWYRGQGRRESARVYYLYVRDEYATTPWAETAARRLEALGPPPEEEDGPAGGSPDRRSPS